LASPENALVDGLYLKAISKSLVEEVYPELDKRELKKILKIAELQKLKTYERFLISMIK